MTFKCSVAAVLGLALIAVSNAIADTVHFSDGTSLDGKVTQVNENCIAVESGSGRMLFQVGRVERIEKNDKAGTIDLGKTSPRQLEFERELKEKTGLTAEQREQVVRVVDKLASEDSNERDAAIKRLVAMQKEVDVFTFLTNTQQSYGARVLPGVLEVMMAIDREKAKPIVRTCATDAVPGNRAAALQIMGSAHDVASLETMARGLVDVDDSVRVAAAAALAMAGSKRATPALLEGLGGIDKRVVNACTAALTKLWSTKDTAVQFDSAEGWKQFWAEHAGEVADPIAMAGLEPLFEPEPDTYVIVHE